jgi:hypothetical protein
MAKKTSKQAQVLIAALVHPDSTKASMDHMKGLAPHLHCLCLARLCISGRSSDHADGRR